MVIAVVFLWQCVLNLPYEKINKQETRKLLPLGREFSY